jgi:hypothetical protein
MQRLSNQNLRQAKVAIMFSVTTWNLENFERPAANAVDAVKDRHSRKLQQISEPVTSARLDLVGDQAVLADRKNLAPSAFDDLRAGLGAEWNGQLSQRPDPAGFARAGCPAGGCPTLRMPPSTRNRDRRP